MTLITKTDATVLASVKGIYEWNKINNYCCKCGSNTTPTLSGWEKICDHCKLKHFPRTDPVVIMMVSHKEKALLGRSSMWPKGMFSCLAGFMEPGETIEQAVSRETFEESGIIVSDVKYLASQPWPFPSSLMLGFAGKAESVDLSVNTNEVEMARWFTREEINIFDGDNFHLPRKLSISRRLIDDWLLGI